MANSQNLSKTFGRKKNENATLRIFQFRIFAQAEKSADDSAKTEKNLPDEQKTCRNITLFVSESGRCHCP